MAMNLKEIEKKFDEILDLCTKYESRLIQASFNNESSEKLTKLAKLLPSLQSGKYALKREMESHTEYDSVWGL